MAGRKTIKSEHKTVRFEVRLTPLEYGVLETVGSRLHENEARLNGHASRLITLLISQLTDAINHGEKQTTIKWY